MEENLHFENTSYAGESWRDKEFEACTFTHCDFSDSILSAGKFIDCTFISCNFSNARLFDSQLHNVIFKECKIMGVLFHKCDDFLFDVQFENCVLDYSSFYKRKMPKTPFKNCSLKGVDFTEADLSKAIFKNCDLSGSIFGRTILKEADLRDAQNYQLDPEENTIKKARFSLNGLPGLLAKYDIRVEL